MPMPPNSLGNFDAHEAEIGGFAHERGHGAGLFCLNGGGGGRKFLPAQSGRRWRDLALLLVQILRGENLLGRADSHKKLPPGAATMEERLDAESASVDIGIDLRL